MKAHLLSACLYLFVVIFAASYFLLSYNRTLNPVDEGYLLNNFVKVAEGQVPHRDFYDDYGPASFWLGGALFKMFGSKIIVIRVFLVVMKSIMALLIFLIARELLPVPFALISAALFTLNWGDPYLPAINILYAGYVCHFLALFAVLFMLQYVKRGNRLWLMAVSAMLGISLLFKFPSAIFDFIAFCVFVSLKEQGLAQQEQDDLNAAKSRIIRANVARVGKLAGLVAVIAFDLVLFSFSELNFYYFFIFLLAYYLLLGYMILEEVQYFRADRNHTTWPGLRSCYNEILLLASGPIFFFLFELVYFVLVGGVDEFLYDTFVLPLNIDFYHPMADQALHSAIAAGVIFFIFLFRSITQKFRQKSEQFKNAIWASSIVPVIAIPIVLAIRKTPFEVCHLRMNHVLPPVVLLTCSYLFLHQWRRERRNGAAQKQLLPLGLIFIFACTQFVQAFPRTDETHIQINSTLLFILIGFLLQRLFLQWKTFSHGGRLKGSLSVAACVGLIAFPQLWSMKILRFFTPTIPPLEAHRVPEQVRKDLDMGLLSEYPLLKNDFPALDNLELRMWLNNPQHDFILADAFKSTEYVRDHSNPSDRIFVMCESQIIYLLAERESFLQKEDYFVFLATSNLINATTPVRLSDEQLLQKLARGKPRFIVMVSFAFSEHTSRIVSIWPRSFEYIKKNYVIAEMYGLYIVLQAKAA